MERKLLWVGIGILAVLAIAIGVVYLSQDSAFRGVRYDPPVAAYDFNLVSSNGTPVNLHDYLGWVVMVFFGYTNCTDICPATLAELRQVRTDLGSEADRVIVVFITVDPARDTPERIQDYVSTFDPAFVGLSGSEAALQAAWDAYGVERAIDNPSGSTASYEVTHTTRLYLIDPQGRLLLSYSNDTPPADLLHDIRLVLKRP
jgi:protein SCO1/2